MKPEKPVGCSSTREIPSSNLGAGTFPLNFIAFFFSSGTRFKKIKFLKETKEEKMDEDFNANLEESEDEFAQDLDSLNLDD